MDSNQQKNKKSKGWNRFKRFLRYIYVKTFLANDTPQRVALGFGVGVFSGIIPGTGPLAALFIATLVRANKASAVLGSLLTNTWLSFIIFIISIKTGAAIIGIDWQEILKAWKNLVGHFHFMDLCKLSALKIALPVILGYCVVALLSGLSTYLIIFILLSWYKKGRKKT